MCWGFGECQIINFDRIAKVTPFIWYLFRIYRILGARSVISTKNGQLWSEYFVKIGMFSTYWDVFCLDFYNFNDSFLYIYIDHFF